MVNETICDVCGETVGVQSSLYRLRRFQVYRKKEKENEQDAYDLCYSCDILVRDFIKDSKVELRRTKKVAELQKQRDELVKEVHSMCAIVNKVSDDLNQITKGHEDLEFYYLRV